jgi:O-methyltransferase
VRFLVGWFHETLPGAPIDRLALLRLDGDTYTSTMDTLRALYPKLSIGGFCVIDDYFALPGARQATDDFRAEHRITEQVEQIDWSGMFWRRMR